MKRAWRGIWMGASAFLVRKGPIMRRRSRRHRSGGLSKTSNGGSRISSGKPTLGDKLQRLARVAPKRVRVIEILVDQMLQRMDPE